MNKPPRNYVPLLASIFALSVIFWLLANYSDIYKHAVIGALFEIAWLPMAAMFALIPVVSLALWIWSKKKGYPVVKPYLVFSMISGLIVVLALTA